MGRTISTDSGVLKQTQYSYSTRLKRIGTNPRSYCPATPVDLRCLSASWRRRYDSSRLETTATIRSKRSGWFAITRAIWTRRENSRRDKAKFDAAVKAAETGCPVSKLFKAEISVNADWNPRTHGSYRTFTLNVLPDDHTADSYRILIEEGKQYNAPHDSSSGAFVAVCDLSDRGVDAFEPSSYRGASRESSLARLLPLHLEHLEIVMCFIPKPRPRSHAGFYGPLSLLVLVEFGRWPVLGLPHAIRAGSAW